MQSSLLFTLKKYFIRGLYVFLAHLLMPYYVGRLLLRSRILPVHRQRMKERFGVSPLPKNLNCVWFHAVSVGELLAIAPLIRRYIAKNPTEKPLVTTLTASGSRQVKEVFGDKVYHCYAPYDYPWAMRALMNRVSPQLLVLAETEMWPNMLYYAKKINLPVVLTNARLSPNSAKQYRKILPMLLDMFNAIHFLAAQSDNDANRFLSLGFPKEKLTVTGNMKFDLVLPEDVDSLAKQLRSQWGENRPVWIAASTHSGEEEQVLEVFKQIRQTIKDLVLILVPRHPERFEHIETLCGELSLPLVTRSSGEPCSEDTAIYLGNTMGEMLYFYAAADVAFVGGSLVPIGGHNLLEPAAFGLPILTGPHVHNFQKITELLTEAGSTHIVKDKAELASAVIDLFQSPEKRESAKQNNLRVMEQNRGATDKNYEILERYL